VTGPQTRAALQVFQEVEKLPATGLLDDTTQAALALSTPLYTNHVVTEDDLAALQPMGKTWLAKSQQTSLAYETILELVAERTHSNVKLVRWLNPQVDWTRVPAGTDLKVVSAEFPPVERKAALIRIHLADRKLIAYDAETNLLVHFPCSIAARVDKRPLGEELHIAAVAPNPNYTFDPAVFPESTEAQQLGRKLILQPGPNNPVGTVWLSLDKPGYGIHGTPKPEEVGRTESHGCFRLANWNAEYLLKLVTVGTPVSVEP
jgi:lipoprotein-anchoring transpeptidase ErfK/SrfK